MFRKWRKKNHGKANGEGMCSKLEEMVKNYNDDHGPNGGRAFLQRYMAKDSDGS